MWDTPYVKWFENFISSTVIFLKILVLQSRWELDVVAILGKEFNFDYDPDSEQGDLIAIAYAKLKTHEDFSGASDV